MKRRGWGAVAFCLIAGAAAACSSGSSGNDGPTDDGAAHALSGLSYEYRVHDAVARADDLVRAGLDLLEKRNGNDLFVLGDAATAQELRALGFEATVAQTVRAPSWQPPGLGVQSTSPASSPVNETYYGGYHTIRAHYAHLDLVASNHPDLARVITYGTSWRKQRGLGGYDLKAICISKQTGSECALSPNSTKPRFFLYAQMHARELTTGDIAWRWIDYLVNNYPTDPAVKDLLDAEEMWIVPLANPDGTEIVQSGGNNPLLQRKNLNTANEPRGGCTVPNHGVDLNRNFDSSWGGATTSTDPCNQNYLGASPDSEPEVAATENLWSQLFYDVRGPNREDPSPAAATGMIISLHSDANTVMFPWYYAFNVHTANDASQRAIANDLGGITGYAAGQSGEVLYPSGGNSGDWAYDKLGTSIFTIEVGDNAPDDGLACGGFFPPYSCQDAFFWPKMKPALLFAAKKAVAPFRAPE